MDTAPNDHTASCSSSGPPLTSRDIAVMWGMSPQIACQLSPSRKIRSLKVGGQWRAYSGTVTDSIGERLRTIEQLTYYIRKPTSPKSWLAPLRVRRASMGNVRGDREAGQITAGDRGRIFILRCLDLETHQADEIPQITSPLPMFYVSKSEKPPVLTQTEADK